MSMRAKADLAELVRPPGIPVLVACQNPIEAMNVVARCTEVVSITVTTLIDWEILAFEITNSQEDPSYEAIVALLQKPHVALASVAGDRILGETVTYTGEYLASVIEATLTMLKDVVTGGYELRERAREYVTSDPSKANYVDNVTKCVRRQLALLFSDN